MPQLVSARPQAELLIFVIYYLASEIRNKRDTFLWVGKKGEKVGVVLHPNIAS